MIRTDSITDNLRCRTCNTGVINTDTAVRTRTLSMALTAITIWFWTPVRIINILTSALLRTNGVFVRALELNAVSGTVGIIGVWIAVIGYIEASFSIGTG